MNDKKGAECADCKGCKGAECPMKHYCCPGCPEKSNDKSNDKSNEQEE